MKRGDEAKIHFFLGAAFFLGLAFAAVFFLVAAGFLAAGFLTPAFFGLVTGLAFDEAFAFLAALGFFARGLVAGRSGSSRNLSGTTMARPGMDARAGSVHQVVVWNSISKTRQQM
jgi:hypothetical protein